MKSIVILLTTLVIISGCSVRPVAMKTDRKYFAPVRTTAQAKTITTQKTTRVVTLLNAEKEIAAKNVTIEVLKRENKRLRDRVAKLEQRLAITNS